MSQIVLQPSGSRAAVEHYGNTITKPVKLSEVKSKLDPKLTKFLYSLFPNGQVPMWGVTPGGSGANVTKWERVEPGAVVLFAGGSEIFGSGVVVTKFHNRALAKHLWGADEESGKITIALTADLGFPAVIWLRCSRPGTVTIVREAPQSCGGFVRDNQPVPASRFLRRIRMRGELRPCCW